MAKESPRMEDDVIKWYCGDAFYLSFEVLDETGNPLELQSVDTITISFYNRQWVCVKKFEFANGVTCDDLVCHIDEQTSKSFPVGKYTYCIKYHSIGTISTVSAMGECEVERCH